MSATYPDTVPETTTTHGYPSLLELAQLVQPLTTPPLNFEQFVELCRRFPDMRMEQETNGQVTIMPPVLFGSGHRESEANGFVWQWNRQARLGKTLSASTGVRLRDGSTKQADTLWIANEKLTTLDPAQLDGIFLPVEPDFVIEIRSKTDDLEKTKRKMVDTWIANGVRLAWLIDPYEEKARVYRANGSIDVITGFENSLLSGEEILPGFELALMEFRLPG